MPNPARERHKVLHIFGKGKPLSVPSPILFPLFDTIATNNHRQSNKRPISKENSVGWNYLTIFLMLLLFRMDFKKKE